VGRVKNTKNAMEDKRPKVGFGVYILNDQNEILLLKRKKEAGHSPNTWHPPGGHLEFKEAFEKGVKREAKEEAGVIVDNINLIGVTNDIYLKENKHYVTLAFLAKIKSGKPKIMEPDICEKIGWFKLNKLPKNLMLTNKHFFSANPDCLCGSKKKFKECCGIQNRI